MTKTIHILLFVAACLPEAAFPAGLGSQEAKIACEQIAQKVDEAVGAKGLTLCIPASETRDGDTHMLMIFSKAGFENQDDRAYWIGCSVLAVDWALSEVKALRGTDSLRSVTIQDRLMRKQHQTLSISIKDIVEEGRQFANGTIKSPEDIYQKIKAQETSQEPSPSSGPDGHAKQVKG